VPRAACRELRAARTVAFPAVSTGIYGWPVDDAARIALSAVRAAVGQVTEASFVLFTQDALDVFQRALTTLGG
jgi:O-acetyl-ADP-ribose deacetylase (regulator of RNase III)